MKINLPQLRGGGYAQLALDGRIVFYTGAGTVIAAVAPPEWIKDLIEESFKRGYAAHRMDVQKLLGIRD